MSTAVEMLHAPSIQEFDAQMETEELIASILMNHIPLERAADVAFGLTRRYRTMSTLLADSPENLRRVPGVCDQAVAAFKIALSAHLRVLREAFSGADFASKDGVVRSYCQCLFQPTRVCVSKVFFTRNGRLIAEGANEPGSLEEPALYPREVVREAISKDANGVFVAFGRKFGDEALIAREVQLVEQLRSSCDALEIDFIGSIAVVTSEPN